MIVYLVSAYFFKGCWHQIIFPSSLCLHIPFGDSYMWGSYPVSICNDYSIIMSLFKCPLVSEILHSLGLSDPVKPR